MIPKKTPQRASMIRSIGGGSLFLLAMVFWLGTPFPVLATVGWETGDMVLDFGLNLESGESTVDDRPQP